MKTLLYFFQLVHGLTSILFAIAALVLVIIAARLGWASVVTDWNSDSALGIIEALGLLAAAVVALQIAETIAEEEVVRAANISAPTRVRRYLSRFFVVVIVSLALEGLVATFKAIHNDLTQLPYAASLLAATAVLLAAWGVFVRLNIDAENLEPEAMAEAKREDNKVG